LPVEGPIAPKAAKSLAQSAGAPPYQRYALTDDGVSPRAIPGEEGGVHTITGLEHNEAGRPDDRPETHMRMSRKRHDKLAPAVAHPGINITKRFGDEGKVDVGIIAWGSTFGEALEATLLARDEGIRCATMKVVMLSPFPRAAVAAFAADCSRLLVPELNHEGQFASLLTGAIGRPVQRLNRVSGMPMPVEDILVEIRRLAKRKKRSAAA
jgi:2-oxoglutarate ferredoxin oxidoreductase subunit alpha